MLSSNRSSSSSTTEIKAKPKEKSLWGSLSGTINTWGMATFLFDTTRELVTTCSSPVADFFDNTLPRAVDAALYIGPAAIMFIPNMINKCRNKRKKDDSTYLSEDETELLDQASKIVAKDSELKDLFNEKKLQTIDIQHSQRTIIKTIKAANKLQEEENLENLNTFTNWVYVNIVRPTRGGMIIALLFDWASKENHDDINKYMDIAYNACGVLYVAAILYQTTCARKKKHKINSSVLFTPKHTPPTLSSHVHSLKEPLLKDSDMIEMSAITTPGTRIN